MVPSGVGSPRQNGPSRGLPSKDRSVVERPSSSLGLVPLSLPCGAMVSADRAPKARDARIASLATRPRHTTPMRPPRGARPERFLGPYRGAGRSSTAAEDCSGASPPPQPRDPSPGPAPDRSGGDADLSGVSDGGSDAGLAAVMATLYGGEHVKLVRVDALVARVDDRGVTRTVEDTAAMVEVLRRGYMANFLLTAVRVDGSGGLAGCAEEAEVDVGSGVLATLLDGHLCHGAVRHLIRDGAWPDDADVPVCLLPASMREMRGWDAARCSALLHKSITNATVPLHRPHHIHALARIWRGLEAGGATATTTTAKVSRVREDLLTWGNPTPWTDRSLDAAITAAVSVHVSVITELARMASSGGSAGENPALCVLWGERSLHRLGGRPPAEQSELLTQLVRWGRAWVAAHPGQVITTALLNKAPVWEHGMAWDTMGGVGGERERRGGRSASSGGAACCARDNQSRIRQRLHGAEKRVATYERKLQDARAEVVQLQARLAEMIEASDTQRVRGGATGGGRT